MEVFLKIDPKYNFNFRDSITNNYPHEEHNRSKNLCRWLYHRKI